MRIRTLLRMLLVEMQKLWPSINCFDNYFKTYNLFTIRLEPIN
ncbi:hypothetical protein HanHA300_Chr00c0071g0704101 [Helianthus annuus]|nr:hypothetical protein HanHA300_Chr00c0071g0704101 [Helianthus annuus]